MPRNSKSRTLPQPTPAELDVLTVLWECEPATVRQVFEVLKQRRSVGYTTVLKLLQNMFEKGLVTRDASQRTHVYRSAVSKLRTQRGLVGDLVNRAFGGSLQQLVLRAIEEKKTSPEELQAIRDLLDKQSKE